MAAVLDRIHVVNAIVALRDQDALMTEARRRRRPGERLPGILFALKDLVATKVIRTTWGSPHFAEFVPGADDLLAARLRQAGAILIGKNNTPEWGQGSHSFNPVYGANRNPYDTSRSAGGSSGGAAAALATRMLFVADGSDMMSSLRDPAAFCNVYGFPPSFGLVPRSAGGENFLSTLATDGPMGRNVEDVARLHGWALPRHALRPRERGLCGPAGRRGARATHRLARRLGRSLSEGAGYPGARPSGAVGFEGLGTVVEDLPPPFPAEELWSAWITLRAMFSVGGPGALYEDEAERAKLNPSLSGRSSRG